MVCNETDSEVQLKASLKIEFDKINQRLKQGKLHLSSGIVLPMLMIFFLVISAGVYTSLYRLKIQWLILQASIQSEENHNKIYNELHIIENQLHKNQEHLNITAFDPSEFSDSFKYWWDKPYVEQKQCEQCFLFTMIKKIRDDPCLQIIGNKSLGGAYYWIFIAIADKQKQYPLILQAFWLESMKSNIICTNPKVKKRNGGELALIEE